MGGFPKIGDLFGGPFKRILFLLGYKRGYPYFHINTISHTQSIRLMAFRV